MINPLTGTPSSGMTYEISPPAQKPASVPGGSGAGLVENPRNPWLFPLGRGFFTQARWYFFHSCDWRRSYHSDAPRRAQSRLSSMMDSERRS